MAKIKLIAGISLVAIFLLLVTGKSLFLYIQAQKDYKRIIRNQVSLTDSLKYYRDRLGREVALSPVLEYKIDDALKVIPELQQEIKNLKIKTGRVETISETGISQQINIQPHLRDTVVIVNNIITPVKSFTYRDPWNTVFGIIDSINAKLNISATDTLIQVVSRGERLNPWLWFFSRRDLVQTIQSRNPANKIVYSRYIKIKK